MLDILKKIYNKGESFTNLEKEASLKVRAHMTGALPSYREITYSIDGNYELGRTIKPNEYDNEIDFYFKNRILNRHPSEHQLFYEWRLSTLPKWSKEIGNRGLLEIQAIFDTQPNFITENQKLREYSKDIVLKNVILDPNGYTGIRINSNGGRLDPLQVEYIQFKYNEKIDTGVDTIKEIKKDNKLCLYDKDYYYEYDGEKNVIINQYYHNLGVILVMINGGIYDATNKYYISFFDGFTEAANILLRNASDDEAFQKLFYPRIIEYTDYCEPCAGTGKVTEDCGDNQKCNVPCKSCNGTGEIFRGLGQVIRVKERPSNDIRPYPNKMVEFVTPNVANNQHVFERCKEMYRLCEKALYLNTIMDAQSGNAKDIDRENKSVFIKAILERVWHVSNYIGKIESALLGYDNGHKIPEIDIIMRPVVFSTQNKSTLINEYKELQSANLPKPMRRIIVEKLAEIISPNNSLENKKMKILSDVDMMYFYNDSEISEKQRMGRISDEAIFINENAYFMLNQIISKYGEEGFMETENEKIIKELQNELSTSYQAAIKAQKPIPAVL